MSACAKIDMYWVEKIYLIRVSTVFMFSPVRSITECFATAKEITSIGFFASVRSDMSLHVFQSWVSFVTILKLNGKNKIN